MTRSTMDLRLTDLRFTDLRLTTTAFAAALTLSAFTGFARAEAELPASALALRSTVMAMSLADAAMPAAMAVSGTGGQRAAVVPDSAATLKPETAGAMASMKPASTRSANAGYVTTVSYDRRMRVFHTPFPLILGIAY